MAKNLMRGAFGCEAVSLGDLYDANTDSLCNKNLCEETPPTAIEMQEINLSEFRFVHSHAITDLLTIFEIEKEQQLSIVGNLCDPKALESHPFINDLTSTSGEGFLGILFTLKTQKTRFCFSGECEVTISAAALKNNQATHAIAEILYGVKTFLELNCKDPCISSNTVDDYLKDILKIVELCVGGQPVAMHANAITSLNQVFTFKINSYLRAGTGVQFDSFQQALEYLKDVLNLVKGIDGGRGEPLSFTLVPISEISQTYQEAQQFQTIPDEDIVPILKCFNEVMEIQQRVSEVYDELQELDYMVSEEDLDCISTIKTRSKESLKKFKKELVTLLKTVRSGTKPPSSLKSFATEFEARSYLPKLAEKKLESFKGILNKLKIMKTLQENGVHYIGKGQKLDDVLAGLEAEDVYVLHYTTKASKKNKAQWKTTKMAFLGYATNPNNYCLLVDNDFPTGDREKDAIKISHFRNGKIVSNDSEDDESDDDNDPVEDSNDSNKSSVDNESGYADASEEEKGNGKLVEVCDCVEEDGDRDELCYVESLEVKPTISNPKMKAYLRLQCPGAMPNLVGKSLCNGDIKTWHCISCKNIVLYGFDAKFYCACGSASCYSYRFFCNDKVHGSDPALAPSHQSGQTKFTRLLNNLEPLKELNILVMGETGVGKSTWINSFVNYLTYDTMDEAEKHGPKYLIGSSFVMTDEDYQPVDIQMGPAENDNNMKGQSVTQMPNSYIFTAGELAVRLVDTPGVGDTRGIDQDKINFQNVLSHLSHLEKLHGICVLLKSNSARLTITFQFCIKELLTHLHKDACKNIVFVFTNARETFYRPGDTFATLRNLLLENKEIKIQLGKETIYCMDNESMRFLAASNQGMMFNAEDRENYSNSWRKAVAENERLVQHVLALRPHSTRETLSLNEARRLILGLTEPLAQISQNIQNNIILAQNRSDEIKDMMAKSDDLKGKLTIPMMDIVAKELPYPRTVCTSSTCVESRVVEGITKVHYKTWCHEHCYLTNVQVQSYPCPELQHCAAMSGSLNCKMCGCCWDVHMHLTYESMEVTKQVIDKNVEELLEKNSDAIDAVEQFVVDVQERIDCLKEEQMTINKVASKCGTFLKQNAITPYNDSVDEYLQQCIRIQKDLVCAGASDKTLKGLEKMLANYREEVKILEMSMKDDAAGHRICPEDIPKLIEELYVLPINGQSLKSFVDVATTAKQNMVAYQEKVYSTPYQGKESFLKRAWKKVGNLL